MLIKLDSSTLTNQLSHNFNVNFSPNLYFESNKYECALVTANLWYSYFNVSEEIGNNVFSYSNNAGADFTDITIPDGNYSVEDLNAYVQAQMKANGDSTVDANNVDVFFIELSPNYNTGRVDIIITDADYQVDFTIANSFRELLGFDSQVLEEGTTTGEELADVTLGINSFSIHCNLVNGSSYENSVTSDILYTFVPATPPYSSIKIEPVQRIYLPITSVNVPFINIKITDQQNNLINLNGEPVSVLLDVRKIKE